jgi:hypothetical protein
VKFVSNKDVIVVALPFCSVIDETWANAVIDEIAAIPV